MPVAEWAARDIVAIAVSNSVAALGRLGRYNRQRADIAVVALTGSNGKTTTRDMITAVISQKYPTLSTAGNLNNEIGLPLTLFRLSRDHRWAVLELGMNHPGEMDRLGSICLPDIGLITNIGPAHLEGLGSLEGVRNAKGELLATIGDGGTAILNADDPHLVHLAEQTQRSVLFFGLADSARIRATNIETHASGVAFTLVLPDSRLPVELHARGRFMVHNALAAAAVGYRIGLPAQAIKAGLEIFKPVAGRLNLRRTPSGVNIIDDTYNANPGSMRTAIETLQALKGAARGILVVGDMLELGDQAAGWHTEIGSWAVRHGVERMYITGDFAGHVADGAQRQGLGPDAVFIGAKEEILKDLLACLEPDDWVLVKGSRGMRMEKIVEGLLAQTPSPNRN
jgi:UDP-N-acetylmuramoyl-tripeptide--D-alanyl-D-alanine ligase